MSPTAVIIAAWQATDARRRPKLRRLLLGCCAAALVLLLRRLQRSQSQFSFPFSERLLIRSIHRRKQWINTSVSSWYALARATVAHRVERKVEQALNSAAAHARCRLKDPAMPQALQRAIDVVLDGLLPDIKHESYRVLDEHLQFLQACRITQPDDVAMNSFSPLSPRRSSPRVRRGGRNNGEASASTQAADHVHILPPPRLVQHLRRLRAAALHALWPQYASTSRASNSNHLHPATAACPCANLSRGRALAVQ
jgi:uncharacterized protein (DUF1778 family)